MVPSADPDAMVCPLGEITTECTSEGKYVVQMFLLQAFLRKPIEMFTIASLA